MTTAKKPQKTKPPEFERRAAILRMIGAGFTQKDHWEGEPPNRHPVPYPVFRNVHLPLTPDEWFSLCNQDGDNYMGGCCGHASSVQDDLNYWFRFPWIDCDAFAEVMISWSHHDGGEEFKQKPGLRTIETRAKKLVEAMAERTIVDPWEKLLIVWWAIQKHYDPKEPKLVNPSRKKSDLDEAIYSISHMSLGLSFASAFGEDPNNPTHQKAANKLLGLAQLFPPIKKLHDLLAQAAQGKAFTGWCIFNNETNEICENGLGLCVFDEEKAARDLLAEWVKTNKRKRAEIKKGSRTRSEPNLKRQLRIRPCTMTIANGIQYTD